MGGRRSGRLGSGSHTRLFVVAFIRLDEAEAGDEERKDYEGEERDPADEVNDPGG